MNRLIVVLLALFAGSSGVPTEAQVVSNATAPYVLFESGPVKQLSLSSNGKQLFLLNRTDNRLEVFRVRHSFKQKLDRVPSMETAAGLTALGRFAPRLVHEASIFTGLEPVSMASKPDDPNLLFVANLVSDSVSVVDLSRQAVVATIPVGDEPRDVEVIGDKLYVACARARALQAPFEMVDHAVLVCDAVAPFGVNKVIGIEAVKPRALATDGSSVFVIPQNSALINYALGLLTLFALACVIMRGSGISM